MSPASKSWLLLLLKFVMIGAGGPTFLNPQLKVSNSPE
jgi:hypothetical protein